MNCMHARFIQIDWLGISKAIGLGENETRDLFLDGRLSGELLQRVVIRNFNLVPAKNCDVYDALFPVTREKLEIRLITTYGIKTAPSNQIGSSRIFNRELYMNKIQSLDYFLFIDLRTLENNIPCYLIPSGVIRRYFLKNFLNKDGSTSSNKVIAKILMESVQTFWDIGIGNPQKIVRL